MPKFVLLGSLDLELVKQERSRDDFEIVITPPHEVTKEMVEQYEELGVDRLIVHLGSQRAERVAQRFEEIGPLLEL